MFIACLIVAYLAFVVYGSLVPLEFRPQPWAQAVEAFRAAPFLNLGIESRAGNTTLPATLTERVQPGGNFQRCGK